jgi:polar amino acid transport system substrate-binding protein
MPEVQHALAGRRLSKPCIRVLAGLTGLAFALLLGAGVAVARDLIVLATPEEPYKFEENGVFKGIDIEVLDEVMRRLGLRYSVELVESGTRIQQEARAGRADILLLFSRKPDREEYLIYPQESYIDISWHFFIRAENEGKITFESFEDLKGLQIGITQDFAYTPEFLNSDLDLSGHRGACRALRRDHPRDEERRHAGFDPRKISRTKPEKP